jgi:hypothetical protein
MDFIISIPQCENCSTDACVCPSTQPATQVVNDLVLDDITEMSKCSCGDDQCECFVCTQCNRKNNQCICQISNEVFTSEEAPDHLKKCDKCAEHLIFTHNAYCYDTDSESLCLASNLCPNCDKDKYYDNCCFHCDPYHDTIDTPIKEYECQYCYSMLSRPDEICWCSEKARYGGGWNR